MTKKRFVSDVIWKDLKKWFPEELSEVVCCTIDAFCFAVENGTINAFTDESEIIDLFLRLNRMGGRQRAIYESLYSFSQYLEKNGREMLSCDLVFGKDLFRLLVKNAKENFPGAAKNLLNLTSKVIENPNTAKQLGINNELIRTVAKNVGMHIGKAYESICSLVDQVEFIIRSDLENNTDVQSKLKLKDNFILSIAENFTNNDMCEIYKIIGEILSICRKGNYLHAYQELGFQDIINDVANKESKLDPGSLKDLIRFIHKLANNFDEYQTLFQELKIDKNFFLSVGEKASIYSTVVLKLIEYVVDILSDEAISATLEAKAFKSGVDRFTATVRRNGMVIGDCICEFIKILHKIKCNVFKTKYTSENNFLKHFLFLADYIKESEAKTMLNFFAISQYENLTISNEYCEKEMVIGAFFLIMRHCACRKYKNTDAIKNEINELIITWFGKDLESYDKFYSTVTPNLYNYLKKRDPTNYHVRVFRIETIIEAEQEIIATGESKTMMEYLDVFDRLKRMMKEAGIDPS